MIVDSSAFVAIMLREPDRDRIYEALAQAKKPRLTIPLVRVETVLNVATKADIPISRAQEFFDQLLDETNISVVSITDKMARLAVDAYSLYGKGRGHPAKLNLADCMVYAAARVYSAPLLFIGFDFSQTDLESVLTNPAPSLRN